MCLILFALRAHPEFPLIIAANRDEYWLRPSLPLSQWAEPSGIVAGRDSVGGGTWLGLTPGGRVAALTNCRDPDREVPVGAPSRGGLVTDYLRSDEEPESCLRRLGEDGARYAGFSLLAGAAGELWYFSNRQGRVVRCSPGVHGLSNHLLDTPWPKVAAGKARLSEVLRSLPTARTLPGSLLQVLSDTTVASDEALPQTGVSLQWERRLSAIRIATPDYGTRCSSVVLVDRRGGVQMHERSFLPGGGAAVERQCTFPSEAWAFRD